MKYQSSRNDDITAGSTAAVLQGMAPDGGLYVSKAFEDLHFDWQATLKLDTYAMAAQILGALLPDFENMEELVRKAYDGKFDSPELTPLKAVGDRYVLELFRGPTSAFKDVALSMLPQLITAARKQEGVRDEIVILTATSGDTGKAALEGFRDVEGTRIIVFYPREGVSVVQQAQMVTQEGRNVCVCAVEGNFDDAQNGVKEIFRTTDLRGSGARLSSANSINIGRLAPQVVYYFRAYADLLDAGRISRGDAVDFVVPTGNFGDILAGYIAKLIGLPVGKLVCASNENNVLTQFLETGCYDRLRPFHKTLSPSMDILVSSNLERLLFLLSDSAAVSGYMQALSEKGSYQISEALLAKIQAQFPCGCCNDLETSETIAEVWNAHQYLLDTHTAVAWRVADAYLAQANSSAPLVVLSTASPYKFPAAVLAALGEDSSQDEFALMRRLQEKTGVPIPAQLAALEQKPLRHKDAIAREDMKAYVLEKVRQTAWIE
ncbi:MAG: threonine synthase [Oscillospiraceae bacterium]|jgi:threonine synthase|nr:threonine synthase [Oscillospiraceae bacterium]